jgi:hypothetical protein
VWLSVAHKAPSSPFFFAINAAAMINNNERKPGLFALLPLKG